MHSQGNKKTDATDEDGEEKAIREFERDLKRNEKRRMEEAKILEDRVNNNPFFRKPSEGGLDYLKYLFILAHLRERCNSRR